MSPPPKVAVQPWSVPSHLHCWVPVLRAGLPSTAHSWYCQVPRGEGRGTILGLLEQNSSRPSCLLVCSDCFAPGQRDWGGIGARAALGLGRDPLPQASPWSRAVCRAGGLSCSCRGRQGSAFWSRCVQAEGGTQHGSPC